MLASVSVITALTLTKYQKLLFLFTSNKLAVTEYFSADIIPFISYICGLDPQGVDSARSRECKDGTRQQARVFPIHGKQ